MENCVENLDENKGFKSFAFIKKHPVWSLVVAYILFTATTFGNMYTLSTFGLCFLSVAIVAVYAYLAYKIVKSNGLKGINAALYYSVIILFSILLCCLFCITAKNKQHLFAFFIAVILIFAYLAVCVYTEIKQKTFSIGTVVAVIFILAYFFRLFYVLYTGYGTRQHDLYLKGEKGHFYYVKYIYEHFSLPKENIMNSQMYHPPFHHIICAAALRFWTLFGVDYIVAYEGLQILTLTESMITLYVCYRILKEVGLENHLNKFPNQLSGGEQQRVSIARAIAKNPKLLLCDEPTGALDSKTGVEVLKLLKKQCDANNGENTVIIVTHNALIAEVADRVIRLKNGQIESNTVNKHPKNIDEVEW